ncbi:unnamed protein product, partial [marine sediment metagenome]
ERLQKFLQKNKADLTNFTIYLLERSVKTRYTKHPHFLTLRGKQFEIATSGTNQGTEQAVYITRRAFSDLDTRLLIDILVNQITLAIARYRAWHSGIEFPFGDVNSRIAGRILSRLRENKIIKRELRDVHKYDMQLDERYAIDVRTCNEMVRLLGRIRHFMPDFAPAVTNYDRAIKFRDAIKDYDYDDAIKWGGLIGCEFRELLLMRGTKVKEILRMSEAKLALALARGIDEIFNSYILENGIHNLEGEEYGKVVGPVRVIRNINIIDKELAKAKVMKYG